MKFTSVLCALALALGTSASPRNVVSWKDLADRRLRNGDKDGGRAKAAKKFPYIDKSGNATRAGNSGKKSGDKIIVVTFTNSTKKNDSNIAPRSTILKYDPFRNLPTWKDPQRGRVKKINGTSSSNSTRKGDSKAPSRISPLGSKSGKYWPKNSTRQRVYWKYPPHPSSNIKDTFKYSTKPVGNGGNKTSTATFSNGTRKGDSKIGSPRQSRSRLGGFYHRLIKDGSKDKQRGGGKGGKCGCSNNPKGGTKTGPRFRLAERSNNFHEHSACYECNQNGAPHEENERVSTTKGIEVTITKATEKPSENSFFRYLWSSKEQDKNPRHETPKHKGHPIHFKDVSNEAIRYHEEPRAVSERGLDGYVEGEAPKDDVIFFKTVGGPPRPDRAKIREAEIAAELEKQQIEKQRKEDFDAVNKRPPSPGFSMRIRKGTAKDDDRENIYDSHQELLEKLRDHTGANMRKILKENPKYQHGVGSDAGHKLIIDGNHRVRPDVGNPYGKGGKRPWGVDYLSDGLDNRRVWDNRRVEKHGEGHGSPDRAE